jgi:clathrin heavy chain
MFDACVLFFLRAEDGPLQTRLLEINLAYAPHVADHILGQEIFTHFNKKRIAELCEQKGLYMRVHKNISLS